MKHKCEIVYHFDVWGNAKDGWEVNDSRRFELSIDISNTRSILKSLRESEFFIKPGSVLVVDQGEYFTLEGRRDQKPFMCIYPLPMGQEEQP